MKHLSIDFGLKHLGLAISTGPLAQPLIQFANNKKAIEKIIQICRDQKIDKIILGLSEGKMAKKTKDFSTQLKKHLSIPIIFQDETLSSKTAQDYLLKSGAKKKKRQQKNHQTAAAVILQNYLDENNQSYLSTSK